MSSGAVQLKIIIDKLQFKKEDKLRGGDDDGAEECHGHECHSQA